jgi:ribosomal protein L7/L12
MVLRRWSADSAAIGDRLASLSPANAAALGRYLAVAHHLVAARVTGIEVVPDVIIEPRPTEPATLGVILEGFAPTRKIAVIRAVRDLLGVGLREALALVDATPSNIRENLSPAEADGLKAQLEAAGATVSLRPSCE